MDNLVSYSRFTSVDPNISQYGSTVEELQLQRGQPDANPAASPMAQPAVSDTRLALARSGSDRLRLDTPSQPEVNPYEGSKLTLTVSRNAVRKLRGRIMGDLRKVVEAEDVAPPNVRNLMIDSMRRVAGMCEMVEHLNGMSEMVLMRSLAVSKG